MIKYILALICTALLTVGCATTTITEGVDVCEEKILDTFVDHEYSVMAWVDEDCDGICDRADFYVVKPGDMEWVLTYDWTLSCEEATEMVDNYKKQMEGRTDL